MTFLSRAARLRLDAGFAYSVQRRYPFRFFTRSIVALLFVLFAVFTTFNVAANGFDMQSVVTNDPNATLAQQSWFQKPVFTFGDDRLSPNCLTRDIAVGAPFITTNKGFSYVLTNIYDADNNQRTSMPYLNNTLRDCKTTSVQIFLNKADLSTKGMGNWWSWSNNLAQLTSSCNVTTSAGDFGLEMRTFYRAETQTFSDAMSASSQYDVKTPSLTTYASAWWGLRMLRMYWMGMLITLAYGKGPSTEAIFAGSFSYRTKNPVRTLNGTAAFKAEYSLIQADGDIDYPSLAGLSESEFFNNVNFTWSRAMTEGLSFVKVFHSLILTDLGDTQQPNLLSNITTLKAALQSPFNFNHGPDDPLCNGSLGGIWGQACNVSAPGASTSFAMEDSYEALKDQTGPLGSRPATIDTQYTCSVPTRKSMFTIVWTTLLANFVLLQVAYSLAMFIATEVVSSRDPTAMYCEGCRTQASAYALTPMTVHQDDDGDTHGLIGNAAATGKTGALSRSASVKQSNGSEYTLLERRPSIEP